MVWQVTCLARVSDCQTTSNFEKTGGQPNFPMFLAKQVYSPAKHFPMFRYGKSLLARPEFTIRSQSSTPARRFSILPRSVHEHCHVLVDEVAHGSDETAVVRVEGRRLSPASPGCASLV